MPAQLTIDGNEEALPEPVAEPEALTLFDQGPTPLVGQQSLCSPEPTETEPNKRPEGLTLRLVPIFTDGRTPAVLGWVVVGPDGVESIDLPSPAEAEALAECFYPADSRTP